MTIKLVKNAKHNSPLDKNKLRVPFPFFEWLLFKVHNVHTFKQLGQYAYMWEKERERNNNGEEIRLLAIFAWPADSIDMLPLASYFWE